MGYYYAELVPPAILFNNPGINMKEFDTLLRKTEHQVLTKYEPIYLLARTLCLPTNESFKKNRQNGKTILDVHSLPLSPPTLYYDCKNNKYEVSLHVRNNLSPSINHTNIEFSEIYENQTTYLNGEDYWYSETKCLVKSILEKRKIKLTPSHPFYNEFDKSKNKVFQYQFVCQKIDEIYEEQVFNSEAELFNKWPRFRPENRFNFSLSNGEFYSMNFLKKNFLWKQVNGRYFFDEKSFDLMPAGGSKLRYQGAGFTDLVVTPEIIKSNISNLPNYNARDYDEEFQLLIEDLPEISKRKIETAIWDAHTSIHAKEEKLTHLELMHRRLEYKLR